MSRPTVPSEPRFALLLIPTPREYAAVAGALGAPREVAPWQVATCGPNIALSMCGIGKANASGAAGSLLTALKSPRALLCLGVAGSLPGGPPIGDVVLASTSVFLDEGVQTADDFISCEQLGFPIGPPGDRVEADAALSARLKPLVDHQGTIATVSTCAGTDHLARRRGEGAIAEAMEGAAAGLVAWRLGVPFAEVRAISNATGDREQQIWDLDRALDRLGELSAGIAAVLG